MSGHTPGPWSVPHFACDDHSCSCGYVLSEWQQGMGAIATVHVSAEGANWRDGDHEPPEIAKANARLIAAAPCLARGGKAVADWLQACLECTDYRWDGDQRECAETALADLRDTLAKAGVA